MKPESPLYISAFILFHPLEKKIKKKDNGVEF